MQRKRVTTLHHADGTWDIVEYYEDMGPSRAAGVNRFQGGMLGHRNRGQVRTVIPAGLTPKKRTVPSEDKKHPSERNSDGWLHAVNIRRANQRKLKGA